MIKSMTVNKIIYNRNNKKIYMYTPNSNLLHNLEPNIYFRTKNYHKLQKKNDFLSVLKMIYTS